MGSNPAEGERALTEFWPFAYYDYKLENACTIL
jgi:hypothetical protein